MYSVLFKVLFIDLDGFLVHDTDRCNNRERLDPSFDTGRNGKCVHKSQGKVKLGDW